MELKKLKELKDDCLGCLFLCDSKFLALPRMLSLIFIDLEHDSAIRVQALMALAAYSVRNNLSKLSSSSLHQHFSAASIGVADDVDALLRLVNLAPTQVIPRMVNVQW